MQEVQFTQAVIDRLKGKKIIDVFDTAIKLDDGLVIYLSDTEAEYLNSEID